MTIASGLILTAKDKRLNLHPSYVKSTCDSLSLYKVNLAKSTWLFMFADYSALLFNAETGSMTTYADSLRDMLEISLRIQNLTGANCIDCPAYLRRDLLKWLRENGD